MKSEEEVWDQLDKETINMILDRIRSSVNVPEIPLRRKDVRFLLYLLDKKK